MGSFTNSFHWALDVAQLVEQIQFGYCWMKTYGSWCEEGLKEDPKPYSTYPLVSYFGDNCIVGIHSCKDKLALMIWSYYCAFDPTKKEEILTYRDILKRFRYPVKYALEIKGRKEFLGVLENLNTSDFKQIEKYRHQKIHRVDPQIIMGKIANFHYREYRFPILNEKDKKGWENSLNTSDSEFIELMEKNSTFNGIQYMSKRLRESLFEYSEISISMNECMKSLFKSVGECFVILDKRLYTKDKNIKS